MDLTGRTRGADFRLHAMDLPPIVAFAGQQRHWILQAPPLRAWLATLARDYRELRAWGHGPFAGRRITAYGVIEQLGLAQRPEPANLLQEISFATQLFVAATRASLGIQRELAKLARAGADQGAKR